MVFNTLSFILFLNRTSKGVCGNTVFPLRLWKIKTDFLLEDIVAYLRWCQAFFFIFGRKKKAYLCSSIYQNVEMPFYMGFRHTSPNCICGSSYFPKVVKEEDSWTDCTRLPKNDRIFIILTLSSAIHFWILALQSHKYPLF